MDSLIELIDNRIDKALDKSTYVNCLLGQVLSVSNDKCNVKLFTTGTVYNIPNYSGSDVIVGEMVYVYYSGGFISNQSAYIGASLNKPTVITYIYGTGFTGALSSNPKKVASFYFLTTAATTINLVFNAVITSDTADDVSFTIIVDNEEYEYVPTVTANDGYTHCSFTLPVQIDEVSSHSIDIKAVGVGSVSQINAYIFGVSIIKSDWVVTTDNDYTFMPDLFVENGERSLRYISNYQRIITPTTLDGKPFLSIGYETFMTKDVTAVQIQAPVTTIE